MKGLEAIERAKRNVTWVVYIPCLWKQHPVQAWRTVTKSLPPLIIISTKTVPIDRLGLHRAMLQAEVVLSEIYCSVQCLLIIRG